MTTDSVVTVFDETFSMRTMTAEQESRRVVSVFHSAFVQIDNLKLSIFLDCAGDTVTGVMYRLTRPANACHIGVDTLISMSDFIPAFMDGCRPRHFRTSFLFHKPSKHRLHL